ncbi:diuretic hormone 44 [Frieseomelitta varia]|uniref:diuretic hormone 44 n=1 Tax=Frieseomelitta varia TaxID=561572 RepID=UPI001CB68747|nr:diuretic hormone 44 [Frieseomelitta varia]XP_043526772.1 diuretic hormone 44 [Frieseomelitta varia]
MTFMSILVSLLFVAMTKSQPVSYAYDERELPWDHPSLLFLVESRIPDLENEMFDSGNDPGSTVVRTKRLESKRIGSLSIVNSLDVLRQRVLLELARRKALQDQRQIDANRRLLESIGKRSFPLYNVGDASKAADSRTKNGIEYVMEQKEKSHDRSAASDRVGNWLRNRDDSAFRERQDDPVRRVQTNELRLL